MTWLLLIIALIIGIILGWLLSRRECTSRLQQSEMAWQRKLATAETKTAETQSDAATAQANARESRQNMVVARGETEVANSRTETARDELAKAQAEAEVVRTEAERAQTEADTALADAERARTEADSVRTEADSARTEANSALADVQDLQSNTEPAAPEAAAASFVAPAEPQPRTDVSDDLTKIEGIGPKIAELLNGSGVTTFKGLAASSVERLREIVLGGGNRFRMHDPATWPEQAALAASGSWEALEALQDVLEGGRRV